MGALKKRRKQDLLKELRPYGLTTVDIANLLCLNADFSPFPGCNGPSLADPKGRPSRDKVDQRIQHVIAACARRNRKDDHMLLNNVIRYLNKDFRHGWSVLASMVSKTKRDMPLWYCCTASKATDRSLDGDVVGNVMYTSMDQVAIASGTERHSILIGASEENSNQTLKGPFQDEVTGETETPSIVDGPVTCHQTDLADENRSAIDQTGVAASSVVCCGRLYQSEDMEIFIQHLRQSSAHAAQRPQEACVYGCGYSKANFTQHEKRPHFRYPCGIGTSHRGKTHTECNIEKPKLIDPFEFFPDKINDSPRPKNGRIEKRQSNPYETLPSAKRKRLRSLDHLEQIIQTSPQRTQRTTSSIPDGTIEEKIDRCFEHDQSYAQAVRNEIQRAGGLSSMDPCRDAPQWGAAGHLMPRFIPADQCRANWPSRDRLIDNLYFNGRGHYGVYSRGQPTEPLDQPLASVVRQLSLPDTKRTYYATNIRTTNAKVHIPECLDRILDIYREDDDVTTVNVTPQGALVDMHWDRGNVLTAIDDGCIKLWGFYPLNDKNCDALRDVNINKSLLLELSGRLEGGEWALQTSEEAVFAAAGTLHVVVTLEGGCVPGRVFHAAQDLETARKMLQLEQKQILPYTEDEIPDIVCDFLKKIYVGLQKTKNTPMWEEQALKLLCCLHESLHKVKHLDLWRRVHGLVGRRCKCGKRW